MIVRCISNVGKDLPSDLLDPRVNLDESSIFPLIPGKDYVVFALTGMQGYVWYGIAGED